MDAKLLRLKKRLLDWGIESEFITAYAGAYYDGTENDHTQTADCLRIEYKPGTLNIIDGLVNRSKGLKMTYYNIYSGCCRVMTKQDAERLEKATNTANTFSDAFWMTIHEHGTQQDAIRAGLDAIKGA